MLNINRCSHLAFIAAVTWSSLSGVIDGQSKAYIHKIVDAHSVWKPSQESIRTLKEAMVNGRGTQQSLLEVMKKDHASDGSLSFAASFSSEAAYLGAIEPPHYFDGFTVGEVCYPFRLAGSRTFVILNGNPRIIDVSDAKFLNNIKIASSADLKTLGDSSLRIQCVWSEPQKYNIQPGAHDDDTQVEVSYPIRDITKGDIIGTAYVAFEFSFPGRKLLGTRLDFIEKK